MGLSPELALLALVTTFSATIAHGHLFTNIPRSFQKNSNLFKKHVFSPLQVEFVNWNSIHIDCFSSSWKSSKITHLAPGMGLGFVGRNLGNIKAGTGPQSGMQVRGPEAEASLAWWWIHLWLYLENWIPVGTLCFLRSKRIYPLQWSIAYEQHNMRKKIGTRDRKVWVLRPGSWILSIKLSNLTGLQVPQNRGNGAFFKHVLLRVTEMALVKPNTGNTYKTMPHRSLSDWPNTFH